VIDFPIDVLDSLISRVDHEVGFLVEPHHAALLGLCADCRAAATPDGHKHQPYVD
jgi:Fur family ferric uptake transcriptional regulator